MWLMSVCILLYAMNAGAQSSGDWMAPAATDQISNPLKGETSFTEGKKMFDMYCAICHGNKGKGDGIGGISLKPRPSNFTKEDIQSQSDGAIYWKLTKGRAPMAGYEEILTEKQRWQLVNYIRTLRK